MFVVEHNTICDEWVNTWQLDGTPHTFATREDAERALAEFLEDAEGMDYDADEFRIVEIP